VRGTVIRLFSPDGTLVVEVDDPGVSVIVDGGDVVITGAGAKEIRLKPGQHKVEASKEGTMVRRELVTVTRKGRQVVRISKESVEHVFNLRDPWEKSVAALPAEEQVEAVVKRLKELNPRFDGRVEPTIRDGVVIGLAFNTDAVSDVSPVRVLRRLEYLACNGTASRQGMVADLSPLRGLPLKTLWLLDNQVTDLSPLRGLPLKTLVFQRNNAIKDLTPLEGMPLEHLECAFTNVADLSPLKGIKLKRLSCDQTLVSDLSPLRGMSLEALSVAHCGRVTDLSPLKGMPLQVLWWFGSAVSDLSPLKGMPLKEIYGNIERERDGEFLRSFTTLEKINGKSAADFWKETDASAWEKSVAALPAGQQVEAVARRLKELNPSFDGNVKPTIDNGVVTGLEFLSDEVNDLSPVHVLDGLRVLDCGGSASGKGKLEDLTPLRGLRLTSLNCRYTQVANLSPLEGMPLTGLSCHGTQVSDLAPLKGMKLRWLGLTETAGVADLAPLRGMPLIGMDLYGLRRVKDIRPLEGMPLEYLNLSYLPVSDLSVLASMKSLRHLVLVGMPVSDLTPLRGLPVGRLGMTGTRVTDVTPLKELPLYHLVLDYRPEYETILRSITGLTEINRKPAAEFWKEVKGK
jgi:Leucine-rich repeat (LRR) protein